MDQSEHPSLSISLFLFAGDASTNLAYFFGCLLLLKVLWWSLSLSLSLSLKNIIRHNTTRPSFLSASLLLYYLLQLLFKRLSQYTAARNLDEEEE